MDDKSQNISIEYLKERAKELECLYLVDEALNLESIPEIFMEISKILPLGFRDVKACSATIVVDDQRYSAKTEIIDGYEIQSPITINDITRGYIKVAYPKNTIKKEEDVFLSQEEKLVKATARKISQMLYQKNIKEFSESRSNWKAIIKLLQNTDHRMLLHVCEKLLTLLAKNNPNIVMDVFTEMNWEQYMHQGEINFSLGSLPDIDVIALSKCVFRIVPEYIEDSQLFDYINLWIYHGKTHDLIKLVGNRDSNVREVLNALKQYLKAVKLNEVPSQATQKWLVAELLRRFLTENPKLIEKVREYISIKDFHELLEHIICSPKSLGKIGGKAAGLFLANQILRANSDKIASLQNIKIPKTWYIASDELENLIHSNHLDELNELKYHDILEIRINYPKIIQTMKNAMLSSYILSELNQVLEEVEGKPLIIRSSSSLEDQLGSSFSGKYKSLFIANTGTRTERLKSLIGGILEVYSSMYSPDSVQYRKEHNLLDCSDQMGIMIQEVVGKKLGPYFFPLYGGVAFSNNEFRWSPRIKREDGLIRLVIGLGTRAVDRVSDDYPVLISPRQPNLRINQVPQEIKKYSPQKMDVIDIENNRFLTIPVAKIIKEYGQDIQNINHVASVFSEDIVTELNKVTCDFKNDDVIITFNGLIDKTEAIHKIYSIMSILKEKLGYPVDIEFASDGEDFYLLQCRPQSESSGNVPVAIPKNIEKNSIIFTANRYISNGKVTAIKTVVYVDPEEYGKLNEHKDIMNVGRAVGELNKVLPRRSFILMGPGRWGSRGDIKLGVQVTYSDINNSSLLIEIAEEKTGYRPEPSFGTHFFQDLVEAGIKYLPLYPEEKGIIFNKHFFTRNQNMLGDIIPQYSYLNNVIKVITIPDNYKGKHLIVLMNAELEKAVAYIGSPDKERADLLEKELDSSQNDNQAWKWRYYMAERISAELDFHEFSVKGIYLFGSTNTCTAKLNSDIDLLVHFEGTEQQKQKLDAWFNGWSKALSEINYLQTGYRSEDILDVHYITDEDIRNRSSYAAKINSIYDPATVLRLKKE